MGRRIGWNPQRHKDPPLIPLRARGTPVLADSVIGRVVSPDAPITSYADSILRATDPTQLRNADQFAGLIYGGPSSDLSDRGLSVRAIASAASDHLADGDIVALDPSGYVRTLFRRGANANFLFATDRCNSYCVMCSQPPRLVDDDWRIQEMLRVIELIDFPVREIGITGGEPTLLGPGLIEILAACRDRLPGTSVHVLTNGRLCSYSSLAKAIGAVQHPDLMLGVPVYSDVPWKHDHVVQSKGAFDQTMRGLHNLNRFGVPIEIRVVLQQHTIGRLVKLVEFIYRNLTFARHVALMGLEATGFAVHHLKQLWIDPWDYREALEDATWFLASRGVPVSIYNHQLCTVSQSIWPYCRQSISDWKNCYADECTQCAVRSECGGFFTSSLQRAPSRHIRAVACRP